MRLIHTFVFVVATLLLVAHAGAATTVIHGIKVEDTATVAGVTLQLNGAGTRYKGPFKVYVGDLYTLSLIHITEPTRPY